MQVSLPDPIFVQACGRPVIDARQARGFESIAFDVVIIGAGVAGLTFALRLPESYSVALLTKGALGESNTRWAQGGLSAAIGVDDTPALHEADTLFAGAGLCDVEAVHALVERAPYAVDWLLSIDTRFDRDPASGAIVLGREAAHSRRRVLHAGGDATGAEIERALVAAVRQRSSVNVFAGAYAIDLLVEDGECGGVIAELAHGDDPIRIESPVVAIAAGGAGQLWATTSNPQGATADGLAMGLRAGAAIADVEFAQFHPTVLAMNGSDPFLVSEAVRGEGAYLRGRNGERFMLDIHSLGELAPRDVVARGIQRQMVVEKEDHVWLDLRHLDASEMRLRFPTIGAELRKRGLDLATDLIPVAPAAHYFMGGIVAGSDGQTSLPGLLALGEAACTGVHGANRLASNSLLEGLVFGMEAADNVAIRSHPTVVVQNHQPRQDRNLTWPERDSTLQRLRQRVQQSMSRSVAVVRERSGLEDAGVEIDTVLEELRERPLKDRADWEMANMALAARSIVSAAIRREESRGAHYRSDFPKTSPQLEGVHLAFGGNSGQIWQFTSLDRARSIVEGIERGGAGEAL